ncbi:MAG: hypothetical protein K1X94_24610 [Sandaracinaceae bacterium]|nr:hypothetical protein [Sandaracinaceae bacterium]
MQLIDLIEKRRFVGRELLLWLWMESELFEATLETSEHGSFGLWIEKKLVLSLGEESTRIAAPMPGLGREAKEALLRGQLPEAAALRIAWKDDETALAIDAESFALRGLKLRTLLDKATADAGGEVFGGDLVDEMAGKKPGRPKKKRAVDEERERELEEEAAFHERMTMTREVEDLLATLYRDFLALRLSRTWGAVVVPAMRRWAAGESVDVDAYRKARRSKSASAPSKARPEKRR